MTESTHQALPRMSVPKSMKPSLKTISLSTAPDWVECKTWALEAYTSSARVTMLFLNG